VGRAARAYWIARLPGLPPPPPVPQRSGLDRRRRSYLERRESALTKTQWDTFKQRASALGVTPSNAVTTAYSYVIATWSNIDHFIVSHMVTRRFAELHPDLTSMIGNFASLYPLEIRLDQAVSFLDNVRRVQRQVLEDMTHLQIGGMRVLQELNRQKGSFGTAPCPFVVGSGLSMKGYKRNSYSVLETSQTVLDHQFFELDDGGYYYMWDLLEEFFPDGVVDGMWNAFDRLLHQLTDDGDAWHRIELDLLGEDDLRARAARNCTAAPLSTATLRDVLSMQPATSSDAVVLRSARGAMRRRSLRRSTRTRSGRRSHASAPAGARARRRSRSSGTSTRSASRSRTSPTAACSTSRRSAA